MTPLARVLAVAGKELLVEWRHRTRFIAVLTFAVAILLLVAFAAPSTHLLPQLAGGTLWIGILLASARSLDISFAVELEDGALEGLVLWPVSAPALFYGKALANTALLLGVGLALTPALLVLYNPPFSEGLVPYLGVLVLGCLAVAAPGTLIAAITAQARGASALLPVLLFPLVVPVVMASAAATTLCLEGDPMNQLDDWMLVLGLFNLIHWSIDGLLFARVVDDG